MSGDVEDGTRFKCASKALNAEDWGEFIFEIWLQPFHLRKSYDSCDIYLSWRTETPQERQFMYMNHIHGEIKLEVVSFFRGFKNQLLSTQNVDEEMGLIAK